MTFTADEIMALPKAQRVALIVQLGASLAMEDQLPVDRPSTEPPDRLITPKEAAQRVGISARTLTKRRHRMPYQAWLVPSGTRLIRFSERRIAEYLATRTALVAAPGQRGRGRV